MSLDNINALVNVLASLEGLEKILGEVEKKSLDDSRPILADARALLELASERILEAMAEEDHVI